MPPPNEDDIEMLVEKGATSFGFNIEIWNDETRRQICPGKSMFSKEQYFKAFHKAQRLLGPNRVGSCLLVGVEDKHFTVEGVHVMVSEGVQPCLLPFKPWDNSVLRDSIPCDPNLLLEISEVAVQGMRKNGIDPTENQGCLQCEGCTVDHDIYSN
jgi:biotin synthase-related radical SAM superfamily protein